MRFMLAPKSARAFLTAKGPIRHGSVKLPGSHSFFGQDFLIRAKNTQLTKFDEGGASQVSLYAKVRSFKPWIPFGVVNHKLSRNGKNDMNVLKIERKPLIPRLILFLLLVIWNEKARLDKLGGLVKDGRARKGGSCVLNPDLVVMAKVGASGLGVSLLLLFEHEVGKFILKLTSNNPLGAILSFFFTFVVPLCLIGSSAVIANQVGVFKPNLSSRCFEEERIRSALFKKPSDVYRLLASKWKDNVHGLVRLVLMCLSHYRLGNSHILQFDSTLLLRWGKTCVIKSEKDPELLRVCRPLV
ncbi:hypothetical protein Tco_0098797 [Tanacetum coccineum]